MNPQLACPHQGLWRVRSAWVLGAGAWLATGLVRAAGTGLDAGVANTTAEPSASGGFASLMQVAFGLAVVLALIFLAGWLVRRLGLPNSHGSRLLKVVSSVMVGQRERVVVVQLGDTWLVLGVGAGRVNALHTMAAQNQPDALPGVADNTSASSFSNKLRQSMDQLRQHGKPSP